jgi:hypothetical protein
VIMEFKLRCKYLERGQLNGRDLLLFRSLLIIAENGKYFREFGTLVILGYGMLGSLFWDSVLI